MAQSDRPEDETPPPSVKRRRRRPPVLELEATEVGAAQDKAEKKSGAAKGRSGSKPEASTASQGWDQWRERAAGGGILLTLVAGAVGAIAGAALVYLLAAPTTQQAAEPKFSVLAAQMSDLTAKIEALAARPVPAPAPAPDQSALTDRIEKLVLVIGEAEKRLAAVEKRPLPQTPDLSAVNERTAAIESTLKELRVALADLRRAADATPAAATPAAVENVAKRIGGLEERIASLAAVRAAAPAEANALAAEVVALNALADAVQSGKPFVGELAAARTRLGDRASALAPLAPLAEKGVPTPAVLSERFALIAPDLLRAPPAGDSFLSRFMSNAARLVEVRRVGEPEGASVDAVVARMETKLSRGDVAGALADADSLPDAARASAAEWLALARQRRDAVQLVQKQIDLTLAGNAEKAKP